MRCILCDGVRWRQWYLCLSCIRLLREQAAMGKVNVTRTETRRIIAQARAVAATYSSMR